MLRGGIILMGLKVHTSFFGGASELALILGVVVVSVPNGLRGDPRAVLGLTGGPFPPFLCGGRAVHVA